jgi:nucleoside-diphosphate-sugar epimerase
MVYASSSSVYGDAERYPTTEDDRPQPISPYGVTKLAAEHLCSLYAVNHGVPTVSLRYFTVYGPRQRPDMAFTRFLTAAAHGTPIDLFGTGEQVRDFTYVDDVVEANLLAAEEDVAPGTVLNIAGGTNISVNEVLDTITRLSGGRLEVRRHPASHGDVRRTGGEASRARELLGWKPRVSIDEGLALQWRWVTGERA